MNTYKILDSQRVEDMALDFLRVIDEAIEDGVIEGRFSLQIALDVQATSFESVSGKNRGRDSFSFKTRGNNPIRNRRHAREFVASKLRHSAYYCPRGFDELSMLVTDEISGAQFAVSY